MKIIREEETPNHQEASYWPSWVKVSAFFSAFAILCVLIYAQSARNSVEPNRHEAKNFGFAEGDEVIFLGGGWGCEYLSRFEDMYLLHISGKNVALSDDLRRSWPLCITSSRVELGQGFTVLEIHGGIARISASTPDQIALASKGGYEKFSYWTRAEWLRK